MSTELNKKSESQKLSKSQHYNAMEIEKKWQQYWEENQTYKTLDEVEGKENFYTLSEFSYPSGNLHVGHWYAFAVPDIFARYKRMQGYNVLYPTGFDAFGLPAENAAIKRGKDPKEWTWEHMEHMRKQLRTMGASFDWSREVVTADSNYYKWTQWMFNQFYKNDMVYRDVTKVNWCDKDKTILANEQVVNGECERCGSEVIQKEMPQWMFKITDFADDLVDDLDDLDWDHSIKQAQREWIGRKEGSLIPFKLNDKNIEVFTTRADTLFGVTYVVLAPEHQLVEGLKDQIENWDEVQNYLDGVAKKSDLDRQQSTEKTGVELKGVTAINPANNEEVPVWIADYVLAGFGTGAVMAVPAHDERDFEFAQKFGLSIKEVVAEHFIMDEESKEKNGVETLNRKIVDGIIHDGKGNYFLIKEGEKHVHFVGGVIEEGETELEALKREVVEESGFIDFKVGKRTANISCWGYRYTKNKNQRSLGPAYEIILNSEDRIESEVEEGKHELIKVSKEELLNSITWPHHISCANDYLGSIKSFAGKGVLHDSGDFGGLTSQEAIPKITEAVGGTMTKTYRLRDWGISRQRYWGCPIPVVYDPEGKPHPVPDEHLPWILPRDVDHTPDGMAPLARSEELKKRTKEIFGEGWTPEVDTMDTFVDSAWYFYRYLDSQNTNEFTSKERLAKWMPVDMYFGGAEHTTMHLLYSRFWTKALYKLGLVNENEPYKKRLNRGLIDGPDGKKMSKSKGNVIDPDDVVSHVGADTVRTYLAFIGPFNEPGNYPWDPNGVVGIRRFLDRVHRLQGKVTDTNSSKDLARLLHKTIKKVSKDAERLKFNTAISAMMVFVNAAEKSEGIQRADYQKLLQLVAPFAPHISEELWFETGKSESIHQSDWPVYDEVVEETVTLAVQVNGKVRAQIEVSTNATEQQVKELALADVDIQKWIEGKDIKKFIYVPGRITNIVI